MSPDVVALILALAFGLAVLLVAACLVAVVAGPTNLDRIVALDLAIVMTAVSLGIFAAYRGQALYMDAALVFAILAFLVTVAVARYLETGRVIR